MSSKKAIKVVILGGGFAGLRCALDVARSGRRDVQVTLVNKSPYHTYYPAVYEIAAAADQMAAQKLRDLVCFSLADICTRNNIVFVQAAVTNVDQTKRAIILEDAPARVYDYAVLALGSESNDFGIPGVREYGIALREADAAVAIQERMAALLHGPHDGGRVVIGGGGVTGVEIAAELLIHVRQRCTQRHDERGCLRFVLIEALPQILSGLDATMVQVIARRLATLGVEVITGCAIKEIKPAQSVVECAGKRTAIPFDLFVWTAGVKPSPVIAALNNFPHDRKGKLDVDEHLRVRGHKNIFAIGDSARFSPHDETGRGLPELAQVAIAEGKVAAKNIVRTITKQSLLSFTPPVTRFIIPVGSTYATADFGFIKLSGWLAHQLKRLVFLKYLGTIFPWSEAIRRWW